MKYFPMASISQFLNRINKLKIPNVAIYFNVNHDNFIKTNMHQRSHIKYPLLLYIPYFDIFIQNIVTL